MIKLIFSLFAAILALFLVLVTYPAASLFLAAHSPYVKLNSIVVKSKFKVADKLKINNFIERLGGPSIAVYCYNLFPLNSYELYLYTAAVILHYFLLLSLLHK